jgi:hypothetical protein
MTKRSTLAFCCLLLSLLGGCGSMRDLGQSSPGPSAKPTPCETAPGSIECFDSRVDFSGA